MSTTFDSFSEGRYQVQRRIGEGGKGTVFLARDTALDRHVAIKVIRGEDLGSDNLHRIQREMQTMARLIHPNVVAIHDVGQEEGHHYLVLEYLEGGDLEELTRAQGPLEADAFMRVSLGVAEALKYAHDEGILHRDVKPGNIWLTKDGVAKLGDFGLAIADDLPRVTREGMTAGTVAYMPPEQALGRDYEPRSDLYMLGATLFHLITGRPPFLGDDPVRIVFSHINDPPIPPRRLVASVPPPLDQLILKLLAKEIDRRPQSAQEVVEALEAMAPEVLRGAGGDAGKQQTTAPAVAMPTPESRWARPLLGRKDELELLRSHVNSALGGQGRLVLITGEAGIGKTRLALETLSYARLRDAMTLEVRCARREKEVPYGPWLEAVRTWLNQTGDPRVTAVKANYGDAIARLVPELNDGQGVTATPNRGLAPRAQRFDDLTAVFGAMASEAPLVLLLDDLQWVDELSMEFLHHLARQVVDKPLLLVAAYRPSELADIPELTSALLEINRERLVTTIPLNRLSQAEVAEMVAQTFGEGLTELVDQIFDKTEGNPFFVEEILRSVAEQGAVRPGAHGWELVHVEHLALPPSIKSLVQERITRLESQDCQELLRTSAVIGSEISFALLQDLLGWDEDRLIDALDECIQQRLIAERRGGTLDLYRFVDNQVREVLYESISPTRRRRLHRRTGEAIERIYGERLDEHVEELAHHFVKSNDGEKATEYALKAGDRAREIYTVKQAIAHYETALSLLEGQKKNEERIAATLYKLGNAYGNSVQAEKAIDLFVEAVTRFEKLNDPLMLARTHWSLALIFMAQTADSRDIPRSIRHLDEAAQALGEDPDVGLLAQIYFSRSFTSWMTVRPAEGIEFANKSTVLARDHLLYQYFGAAGMVIGFNMARQGQVEAGQRLLEGIVRLALTVHQREAASIVSIAVIRLFNHLLDAVQSLEWLEKTDAIKEETVSSNWAAENLGMYVVRPEEAAVRIFVHCLRGDLDKAKDGVDELQEILEESNHTGMLETSAAPGLFYRWQGDWDRAEVILKDTIEQGSRCQDLQLVAMSGQWLGELYVDMERYEEAVTELERSLAIYSEGEDLMGQVQVLPTLCRARTGAGELDQAQEALDSCLAITSAGEDWHGLNAPIHLARAAYDAAKQNWEDALDQFQQAVDVSEKYSLTLHSAEAQLQWASVHLSRRWRGDEENARKLLEQSLATFRSCGARRHAEKAAAALEPMARVATRDTVELMLPISGEESERAQGQASLDGDVTIFFSDIEGSTEMRVRLGDEKAQEVLRAHNRITRLAIEEQGGTEVKAQGDGFMVAFSSVRRAVLCAVNIQRAIEGYNRDNPDEPIRVRIGFHTGRAIQEEEDFFGVTVVKAARITDLARGGQIVVSDVVHDLAGALTGIAFTSIGEHSLKGLRSKHLLYEVSW